MTVAIREFLKSNRNEAAMSMLYASSSALNWVDWRDGIASVERALADASRRSQEAIELRYFAPSFVTDSRAFAILPVSEWEQLGALADDYFVSIDMLPANPFDVSFEQASKMAALMRSCSPKDAVIGGFAGNPGWKKLALDSKTRREAYYAYKESHSVDLVTAKHAVDAYVAESTPV